MTRPRNALLRSADAERVLEGMDKGAQKLFRKRGVRLLTDLFHDLTHAVDAKLLIECGAREAEASTRFVSSAADRRAIAFEANPWTFQQLTRLAAAENLLVLHEGLGRHSGQLVLLVPSSGSEEPTPGNGSFLPRTDGAEVREVVVPVTTLDEATAKHSVAGSVALWVDVEGFSREVLAGGAQLLREHVDIALVEVEDADYWSGGAKADEISNMMTAAGLLPVARDVQDVHQYNILYVRTRFAPAVKAKCDRYARIAFRPVSKTERTRAALRGIWRRGPVRVAAGAAKAGLYRLLGPERARALKRMLPAWPDEQGD